MTPPVPLGAVLLADPDTAAYDGGRLLVGGSPRRALRLTDRGAALAASLLNGAPVTDKTGAALARRLLDGGLAHPAAAPTPAAREEEVEVVVPCYGAAHLDDCLTALAGRPVTVVDDGSPDGESVAAVAKRHGATYRRLPTNRGPAAARNAGLAATQAEYVAFVDSDAVVAPATLKALAAMLTDPAVAAVAPRILPTTRHSAASRRLDLGDRQGVVRPGARVSFVPSTVLVVRREAMTAVGGFDEELRVGEDVDLGWRLACRGWTVRYEPTHVARHTEPTTFQGGLARSAKYGGSAGPLAVRHPGQGRDALSPPLSVVAAVTLATRGRWRAAGLAFAGLAVGSYVRATRAGVPPEAAARAAVTTTADAATHASRWLLQIWAVPLVATSPRRALALAILSSGHSPARVADDLAYGAGVWRGCLSARTPAPVRPRRG